MIRFNIQFGAGSILLLFSTLTAWYEGSAIIDHPWEWRYTTPFTKIWYGEINKASDISQLDFFVYAAKFHPFFPGMMILSCLYLFILIGYYLFKHKENWFAYFLSFISIGLFLLSFLISQSPTNGGQIIFEVVLLCGVLCIGTALIYKYKILNWIWMRILK